MKPLLLYLAIVAAPSAIAFIGIWWLDERRYRQRQRMYDGRWPGERGEEP